MHTHTHTHTDELSCSTTYCLRQLVYTFVYGIVCSMPGYVVKATWRHRHKQVHTLLVSRLARVA